MSHDFVDEMLEKSKAGDLRSPVSETLGMHLVEFGRGEAVYEMAASEELGNPLGVAEMRVRSEGQPDPRDRSEPRLR